MKRTLFNVSLAALVFVVAPAAFAVSDNLSVTADVPAECRVTAGSLAFGAYAPIGANATSDLDAQGSFSVTCTNGTPWTITLGAGANHTGTTRAMVDSGSHLLAYELYTLAGRSTVWEGATSMGATGSGSAQSLDVFGRVPAGQNAFGGTSSGTNNYADTVVVTVNF